MIGEKIFQIKSISTIYLFSICMCQLICASENLDQEFSKNKEGSYPYYGLGDTSQEVGRDGASIVSSPEEQTRKILKKLPIKKSEDFLLFLFDGDSGENEFFSSDSNASSRSVSDESSGSSRLSSESEMILWDDSKKSKRRTSQVNTCLPLTDLYVFDETGWKLTFSPKALQDQSIQ